LDIKEYISSGILESYVLGLASEAEAKELELLAIKHPEVQLELDAIRAALETYAVDFAVSPPAQLKAKIFNSIFKNDEEDKLVKMKPATFNWLSIAASIFLVFSVALNVFFYNRWQRSSNMLAQYQLENYELSESLKTTGQELESSQNNLAILRDKNNVMVNLRGLETSPEATAVVVWNSESKNVYLVAHNLPKPRDDKQYQLWAIVDGKPVDAGVFESTDSIQQLKSMNTAQAFAITLETKGGNPTPQGQMYVLGTVKV